MSHSFVSTSQVKTCSDCENDTITEKERERYCKACGKVYGEFPLQTKETSFFSPQQARKKKRTGSEINFNHSDQGMATKIGNAREIKDSYNPQKYFRLQKWQKRKKGKTRHRSSLLRHVRSQCSHLKVPNPLKEEATRTAWKVHDAEVQKGRKLEAVASGIIHMVSREMNFAIPLDELSDVSGVEDKYIGRAYRQITRKLDRQYAPMKPSQLVFRYSSKLDNQYPEKAFELAKKVDDAVALQNRSSKTLASACIYIVEHVIREEERDPITQPYISEMIGISESSIRDNYRAIVEELEGEGEEIEEIVQNI